MRRERVETRSASREPGSGRTFHRRGLRERGCRLCSAEGAGWRSPPRSTCFGSGRSGSSGFACIAVRRGSSSAPRKGRASRKSGYGVQERIRLVSTRLEGSRQHRGLLNRLQEAAAAVLPEHASGSGRTARGGAGRPVVDRSRGRRRARKNQPLIGWFRGIQTWAATRSGNGDGAWMASGAKTARPASAMPAIPLQRARGDAAGGSSVDLSGVRGAASLGRARGNERPGASAEGA